MFNEILRLNPVLGAFLCSLFTWFMTAAGAALVFFFKDIQKRVLDLMLGFAAGIMTAASCWSLLVPAIEMSAEKGNISWLPPLLGFLTGGIFLRLTDFLLPHFHRETPYHPEGQTEGIKTSWPRRVLLILAITLHNIPEGLAVGVAIGAAAMGRGSAFGGLIIALGMGIQNFPEGAAVSVPLRKDGMSRFKAFMYGQASGVVEPIAAVLGAMLVTQISPILPYALAFAAGAMIYVVVEELIPEAQQSGDSHLATMGTIIGFALMMVLDTSLG